MYDGKQKHMQRNASEPLFFRQKVKSTHPPFNTSLSFSFYIPPPSLLHKGDQVYAQQQSSLINKAYATLKEPLSRANYILEVLGAPIHETESLDETELLMEVMEARELLEDAQTEEEVDDLKHVNDGKHQRVSLHKLERSEREEGDKGRK